MKFIELHELGDHEEPGRILIDVDRINYIREVKKLLHVAPEVIAGYQNGPIGFEAKRTPDVYLKEDVKSVICIDGGEHIIVKETPDEILAAIREGD